MDPEYGKYANKSWETVFHKLDLILTKVANFQTVTILTSTHDGVGVLMTTFA